MPLLYICAHFVDVFLDASSFLTVCFCTVLWLREGTPELPENHSPHTLRITELSGGESEHSKMFFSFLGGPLKLLRVSMVVAAWHMPLILDGSL